MSKFAVGDAVKRGVEVGKVTKVGLEDNDRTAWDAPVTKSEYVTIDWGNGTSARYPSDEIDGHNIVLA